MAESIQAATAVDLRDAVALLEDATSVTILCHVQPDADTFASGLALGTVLERRGIPVQVAFASPTAVPASMRDLPGGHLRVPAGQVRREVDLLVTVDCGTAGRLGHLADRLAGAKHTLVIDHHRSNTRFGTHNLIDEAAESTTAVLAELFDEWGVEIDADLAHCLYAGLVTDTGSFRWGRAGGHRLAERLLATGIDGAAITRRLLDTHPFGWLPMLSRVLASATLVPDAAGGRGLVHATVLRADSAHLGAEEVESVIDIVRTTAEAEVAAVFKECGPDVWTVSLRSKNAVDVSVAATALGGGGHRFASGYTAYGDRDRVVTALRAALD
ncbi:bifunctional oligoribonuclease/PAP phosphatase NrnA [Rhodococcus aetherivorans]|uniref:DHH family phosphoesterase n=1 Tax=Rhodococcus TaxID=1827 RepID=UPI00138728F0|nr:MULTISPECIES: bifunctional oligoribonuclease/PAP phosphatase NrnA [Rhodococcus]MDV6291702.1 bifunctional oligoribonuclease/PAP phosphatase NrnA [Rhodococcus aetherivorans]NCL77016.1 Bifunctional oligoribonuclease and PAP phosphatase NrnA [Rhodococcus sp. YH1]QIX50237.1 bifunctional oligoribonuclease/PAP phosphatase NrnA [Rhodococcus sp. DMU1]